MDKKRRNGIIDTFCRKLFGYGILISVTLFILFWNLNLLIVYAIKRFDNWWEFIGFVIFIMVSLLVLWLVNLVCSKILLKDSFDLISIILELFS